MIDEKGNKHPAMLKICHNAAPNKELGIFLLSNKFPGCDCILEEREEFNYSWVLLWEYQGDLNIINKINKISYKNFLGSMPRNDWKYIINNKHKNYFKGIQL